MINFIHMAEHFDCKKADGFSSVSDLVRSFATPVTLRSAVAALMVTGCAPSGGQQEAVEPRLIPSSVSKPSTNTKTPGSSHDQLVKTTPPPQALKDKPRAKERFDAVCQSTGEFNITPKDNLLMEARCVKDTAGHEGFQTKDMELKSTPAHHLGIKLIPFETEAHISIERTRDQVTVTLSFIDEKGTSHNIKLPKRAGEKYEYSFTDHVPDDMMPINDWRTFEYTHEQ